MSTEERIPYRVALHLKMNGNDISSLSYKELQALALRYRVPGNIKKKLLVKVLQAAKGGNENEVGRLLQDLKQNRKRKVRKVKVGKLALTSTPLHSPDYAMADDYYCPQQQPPYQWVGAEEEITNRDDDNRIPHYEEFKQFLIKRIQREFQTYDANNNQIQDSTIVDLRTATVSSDVQKVPLDISDYSKSNIVPVNNVDSSVYQPNDNVEYQTLEDSNVQGPILLKKMLQAPVGANLGEIASPVFGRFLSVEQYQSNNLLDNSDTLTAESDNQDNEEILENNTECYGLLSGIKGEYFLNEPTFVKNVEEIGQQISNVLTNENVSQYKYSNTNVVMHQDYENWTITNVMNASDNNCPTSDVQPSKIFQTMYYDNIGSDALNKPINDESLTCQYRMAETVHPYSSNQNLLNLEPLEDNQYCDTNIIPQVQSDCNNTYYLQNLIKCSTETTGEYLQYMHSFSNANTDQETYGSTAQTFSNNNYSSTLPHEYSCSHNNQGTIPLSENVGQPEQNCANSIVQTESNVHRDMSNMSEKLQMNEILDPFWPKKISKMPSDSFLENILNFINTKRIDLSKLDQTSCVYCYIAPIVTHTPVSSSVTCSQKKKFVAEYRQHSFSPCWLLYNDTSSGMRMANLQTKIKETMDESRILYTPMSNSNSDIREVSVADDAKSEIAESEDSISEVWPNNYSNYEMAVEKDVNICEDLKIEVSDCLFSVINTEPLDSQTDDSSKN